jgi:hypothetical protein
VSYLSPYLFRLLTQVYRSRLSLANARWLPRDIRLAPEAFVGDLAPEHLARQVSNPLMVRRTPTPDPNDSEPAPGRMARDAEDQIRLEGEFDGRWLLTPGLASKRVDVIIQGVDSFPRTNKMNVTDKMRQDNDKCAILLNGSKFKPSDLQKTITLFNVGGPTGRKAAFPPPCIRPRRELASGKSITEVVTRVIVLGPDVNNHLLHIGQYGQTQPTVTHTFGPRVVAVKFVGRAEFEFYHYVNLCLSENVEKETAETRFPVTNFI